MTFDWDFKPLGGKILADALSRDCPACGAAVGEPCSGLDGEAFHGARCSAAWLIISVIFDG